MDEGGRKRKGIKVGHEKEGERGERMERGEGRDIKEKVRGGRKGEIARVRREKEMNRKYSRETRKKGREGRETRGVEANDLVLPRRGVSARGSPCLALIPRGKRECVGAARKLWPELITRCPTDQEQSHGTFQSR